MKVEDVRAMSDGDILNEIERQRETWRNLRFQNALGRLTSFHELREVRKSIARLKTVLREREIARDPEAYYAANDRIRARRRAEDQQKRVAARQRARRRPRGGLRVR
ncbi:MAG: 50S ribosomal protein L29 [Chloroflexota bacterium]|nr:50S ribosomal protein L29 [Chloroflexota bacterium]